MSPDALEKVIAEVPIAYVPLGTFEHHGFHLPVCFDGIKAHAICERAAQRTGGIVLPTFFYGTGDDVGYKWTLMLAEPQIAPLIAATLDHLTSGIPRGRLAHRSLSNRAGRDGSSVSKTRRPRGIPDARGHPAWPQSVARSAARQASASTCSRRAISAGPTVEERRQYDPTCALSGAVRRIAWALIPSKQTGERNPWCSKVPRARRQ